MKYLFFALFPAIAFAGVNFIPEKKGSAYPDQTWCERATGQDCFAVESGDIEFSHVIIEDVEVCEEPIEGEAPQCRIEKRKVVKIDEAKRAEKVAKDEADKDKADADADQCRLFKMLVKQSVIDSKSKAEDVQEVTRRLLGKSQWCNP